MLNFITRRNFLRATGAGLAGTAVGIAAEKAQANETFEGNPDRFGVLVDTTLCIGLNCRRCEFACAKENNLPTPAAAPEDPTVFDIARRSDASHFTFVNRYERENAAPVYAKRQCMHCDEPACASACLVRAFTKNDNGAVTYNPSVCIGCRYCMVACPFDIPAYEYHEPLHPRVRKCSLCADTRLKEGRPPACVEACPREVMTFGKREELIKLAHQKIGREPDRYVDHVYGEHEVGGTSWMYMSGIPFDKLGFRTDLGTAPYSGLARNYLSAAPLVMAIWPGFFLTVYLFAKHREQQGAQSTGLISAKGEQSDGRDVHS